MHGSQFAFRAKYHLTSHTQQLMQVDTADLTVPAVQPKVLSVFVGEIIDFIFDEQLIVLSSEGVMTTVGQGEKKINKYKKMSLYSCIKRLSPSRREVLIAAINGSGHAHISVFSPQLDPICHLELPPLSKKSEAEFPISDMLSVDTSSASVHVLCVRKKQSVDLVVYKTAKAKLMNLLSNIKVVDDNKPIHSALVEKSRDLRFLIGCYGMIRSVEFICSD